MTGPEKLQEWERFVVEYAGNAYAYDVAAAIGKTEQEIMNFRDKCVCAKNGKRKGFYELFTLWHGRAPSDEEWPAPRQVGTGHAYEWQAPEVALLASLVGQISQAEIASILSARLREKTGNPDAERTPTSVQIRTNLIGLQSSDVVGGLTIAEAARDIGSFALVNQAVDKGQIPTRRIGRLHVISYAAWEEWKAKRVFPPKGYVQLSTLREPMGIHCDKLSEYAGHGLIPTAIRCNPYGTKGRSTAFGTWWVSKETVDKMLDDRRAGRKMPWAGKDPHNLRNTFKLWEKRKHPASCATCAHIWGPQGAPANFEDYAARYPALAHGAKRHLTRIWSPGLTVEEVARQANCTADNVQGAIDAGVLTATIENGEVLVTRTDVSRWIARKCPLGDNLKSWISIEDACKAYLFTVDELRTFILDKRLKLRIGFPGASNGVEYVLRHQCGQLREKIGFTEAEAALRLGITVEHFRHLLEGVDWRNAEKIPLVTIQAVRKRMDARYGHSVEDAATALGKTTQWVWDRIEDGTARIARAPWDPRVVYITDPMLKRLRKKAEDPAPKREKLDANWLTLNDAAMEAGVSLATLNAWGSDGRLQYRMSMGIRHYHRAAVRAAARKYWETSRFHRATPPVWLQAESRAGNGG